MSLQKMYKINMDNNPKSPVDTLIERYGNLSIDEQNKLKESMPIDSNKNKIDYSPIESLIKRKSEETITIDVSAFTDALNKYIEERILFHLEKHKI
jgi:hypothetical protein